VDADHIRPGAPTGAKGSGFGEQLRRAREARGVTLEAVSDATRIALRHLEALERSDLGALPAGPFGKGYVRTYAMLLGIDPEPILEAYRLRERQRGVDTAEDEHRLLEHLSHLMDRRIERKTRPARFPPRPGRVALAFVLLGIVGALGWFFVRARAPHAAATSRPEPAVATSRPQTGREATRTVEASVPTPVPAPPGRPTAPAPAVGLSTDALQVSDHGVGTGLVDHRLVGRADRFAEGTPVSFWTLVRGGRPGHIIRHVWFQEGRAVMRVDLPIGGPYWRTHSRLLLPGGSAGLWAVEARTSDGRLLARDEFLCESDRQ
jgi:transcriptional regulator with XRE-family HTH domain